MQEFGFGLSEPCEAHPDPLLELVQVPLNDILSLRRVNCTTQLGVNHKLAESAHNPTVCVIDKGIKQHWSQYNPLGDTTHFMGLNF